MFVRSMIRNHHFCLGLVIFSLLLMLASTMLSWTFTASSSQLILRRHGQVTKEVSHFKGQSGSQHWATTCSVAAESWSSWLLVHLRIWDAGVNLKAKLKMNYKIKGDNNLNILKHQTSNFKHNHSILRTNHQ